MKISSFFISTLFIVITLTSSLKIAGTIGYYAIFTEDFIERFCENKDRPELQCEGKCELSKMLLQKADDKKPPINIDFLKNETILFIEAILKVDLYQESVNNTSNLHYTDQYNFCYIEKVIHPPQI